MHWLVTFFFKLVCINILICVFNNGFYWDILMRMYHCHLLLFPACPVLLSWLGKILTQGLLKCLCSSVVSSFHCTSTEEKEKVACEQPPSIEHGAAQTHSEIYFSGDKVTYRCEGGYYLRGSSTITCSRGQWTLPPECVGMCVISNIYAYGVLFICSISLCKARCLQNWETHIY